MESRAVFFFCGSLRLSKTGGADRLCGDPVVSCSWIDAFCLSFMTSDQRSFIAFLDIWQNLEFLRLLACGYFEANCWVVDWVSTCFHLPMVRQWICGQSAVSTLSWWPEMCGTWSHNCWPWIKCGTLGFPGVVSWERPRGHVEANCCHPWVGS